MVSSSGMITTPHYLATEAGQAVLDDGGTAIDAVISAAAVLSVVYPHMTGLGGDSWSLVRTPDGETLAVNGTGRHSSNSSAAALAQRYGAEMPLFGPDAAAVPGAVKAWGAMHKLGGTRSWAELFHSALTHAQNGVEVSGALGRDLTQLWSEISSDPGLRDTFQAPSGGPSQTGDTLVFPALAKSLALLSAEGPESLYTGGLSEVFLAGLHDLGSPMTSADLAAQDTVVTEPLTGVFRGHRVWTAPPNSQGFTLIQLLAAWELAGLNHEAPGFAKILTSLFSLANDERDTHLADSGVDVDTLTSDGYIARLLDSATHRGVGASPGKPRASGDTVALAAIDSHGWAVSSLHSIFYSFGARVLEPNTGIILQNRSASFSLDPGHAAYFQPGKRPPSTLVPVFLDHPDGTLSAVASMGGRSQAQIQTQLLHTLTLGHTPHETVSHPRWIVGAFGPDLSEAVVAEDALPVQILTDIQDQPIPTLIIDGFDDRCGHAQIIQRKDGSFLGGSDPRADGVRQVL